MIHIFHKIRLFRTTLKAPVDTMGCTCIPETQNKEEKKFRILIMLLLSPQTKDLITYSTVHKLNKHLIDKYGNGISTKTISKLSIDELENLLKPVNFYKTKAKNILKIAFIFKKQKLPTEYSKILKLPGIGNKIAFLYLQHACKKIMGISVDTHVHRITNRLGIVKSDNPEQTRLQLEKLFDKQDWIEVNKVLVGFGQMICLPRNPKCSSCLVKNDCKYFKELQF